MKYALAPNPIYRSIQGEGALLGEPMVFIRFAGCSVGCKGCDTDYRVAQKATASEIAAEAAAVRGNARWAWITGGEPTDRDLGPFVEAMRKVGFASLALATAGIRPVLRDSFEWISVSPHVPGVPALRRGDEVKLVVGLNGLSLDDCDPAHYNGFPLRYVCPCDGNPGSMRECLDWVSLHRGWRLGGQLHKLWGVE